MRGQFVIIEDGAQIHPSAFLANYVHVRPRAVIGKFTEIRDFCFIAEGAKVGDNTRIMQFSNIAAGSVVGDWCFIGMRTVLCNDRKICYPNREDFVMQAPVIGDYVRIGSGAVILPGVKIGDHALIGAGSVVTKDVEVWAEVMGNPARVVKNLAGPKA